MAHLGQHAPDMRTIEVISVTQNQRRTTQPSVLTAGFRSESPNPILRHTHVGAARSSFPLKAQTVDIVHPGMAVDGFGVAASLCRAGGVGCDLRQGFVYVDCDPRREACG